MTCETEHMTTQSFYTCTKTLHQFGLVVTLLGGSTKLLYIELG